jgi:PII-like signaling protein
MVTIIIDTPERIARSFEIVDELTDHAGLVTSEMVPAMALLAAGERQRGGLRLARHDF